MAETILDRIVADKKKEVEREKKKTPISLLEERTGQRKPLDFAVAVRGKGLKMIAEVKKASPSKGVLCDDFRPVEIAKEYERSGASALSLITALLEKETLEAFLKLGKSLNLDCLVEVHDEDELFKAMLAGAKIIGINNRDLNTFKTDTNTTRRLRMLIPSDIIVVSESGINSRDDIKIMIECKVDAVLVGEALVTAKEIPAKIKELMG